MRDRDDDPRVDRIGLEQPVARRLGHHDHAVREPGDFDEDVVLVLGGYQRHRVQDDDGGRVGRPHQVEHLVAVGATKDAVFVLDDDGIAA